MTLPTIGEVHKKLVASTTEDQAREAIRLFNWCGFGHLDEQSFMYAVRQHWPHLAHLVGSRDRTYTGD